jgi:hypothetical protein
VCGIAPGAAIGGCDPPQAASIVAMVMLSVQWLSATALTCSAFL